MSTQDTNDERPSDEKPTELKQTVRVLKILYLLQKGWHSINAIRQKVAPHVSERSIYRDIDQIQKFLNNPIQKNDANEYRIRPGNSWAFFSQNLTHEEALAIFLLCRLGRSQPGAVPYLASIESALQKLLHLLPEDLQSAVLDQLLHVNINLSKAKPLGKNEEVYKQIWDARWKRYCVQIDYDSISEGNLVTIIQPFHVQFSTHSWYVIGRSAFHQEVRIFNIERIRALKPLPERVFVLPFGWNYEDFRGNAWNMFRSGPDVEVHLHFESWIARNVSAAQWHKTQRIVKNPDGSIEFYATVSGIAEIQWWVLGYGDSVEVISPPELREAVVARIRKMADTYGV